MKAVISFLLVGIESGIELVDSDVEGLRLHAKVELGFIRRGVVNHLHVLHRNGRDVAVGGDNLPHVAAIDVTLKALIHVMLQHVHRGLIASTHATAPFTLLVTSTTLVLAGVEMGSSEVGGGVVVGTVGLTIAACLTAVEPAWSLGWVLTDPDFANNRMVSLDMAA